jgi:hypothetical protein
VCGPKQVTRHRKYTSKIRNKKLHANKCTNNMTLYIYAEPTVVSDVSET